MPKCSNLVALASAIMQQNPPQLGYSCLSSRHLPGALAVFLCFVCLVVFNKGRARDQVYLHVWRMQLRMWRTSCILQMQLVELPVCMLWTLVSERLHAWPEWCCYFRQPFRLKTHLTTFPMLDKAQNACFGRTVKAVAWWLRTRLAGKRNIKSGIGGAPAQLGSVREHCPPSCFK